VIYSLNGRWAVAKSQSFCNAGAPNPPTYGSVTPSVTHNGNDYATNCIANATVCETLILCASMDEAEYQTLAIENGATGSYTTNLQHINVYDSPTLPAPGQHLDEITGLSLLGEADDDGCFSLMIPESWAGEQHFIIFEYVFFIDNETSYFDYIYYAYSITVTDNTDLTLDSILNVDDDPFLNDRICLEYDDIVKLNLVHAGGSNHVLRIIDPHGLVLSAPDQFDTGTAQVIVDANGLALDLNRCLKFLASSASPGAGACTCFDIDLTQTVVATGNGTAVVSLDFALTSLPASVASIIIQQGNNPAETFYSDTGSTQYNLDTVQTIITLYYVIVVILENGCIYTTSPSIQVYNIQAWETQIQYDICDDPPSGEVDCDNVGLISGECAFVEGGQVEITPTFDATGITSPIDTELKEYNINGDGWETYTSGAIEAGHVALFDYLLLRWTVTFSDDCPDQIYESTRSTNVLDLIE
jgi:hypothetical protein